MVKHALRWVVWSSSVALLGACGAGPAPGPVDTVRRAPPATARGDTVDDYHGTRVADPFRWLEEQDDPKVLAWADQQNAYTESYLREVNDRDAVRERLTQLWNFPRWSAPAPHGAIWSWTENDGLSNQARLYVGEDPAGEGTMLLDPNQLAADGTVALVGASFSHDGKLLAYALSEAGSDWMEWRVLDVATHAPRSDHLRWSKFCRAAWTSDGAGFFYQRFPTPEAGQERQAQTRGAQLCYHRLGQEQDADLVVYERPDQPDWNFDAEVTHDGRFAFVQISTGTDRRSRVAWIDLGDATFAVHPLLMDFDAAWNFVGMAGDRALFVTDLSAPRGRIVSLALDAASERTVVVQEGPDRLQSARIVGDSIVVRYLRDAHDVLLRFALDGTPRGEVALPGIGSVREVTGEPGNPRLHFSFESFTRPASVYACDPADGKVSVLRQPELAFDPERFETEQVHFQGADGTPLAMFLVHRKQPMRLDGANPTLLYGYGGFDISLGPSFSVENLVFVERGGIYAQATLRGGGEFGEAWHAAGMREHKQNVFDDFISAARYLKRNGHADNHHLAITGRSNGGLLAAACLVQQPGMFGAAIPEVGVLDMLRYQKFTIGWAWAPEYGTSDDPAMFPSLLAYSPLHNCKPANYPPTLITTGDHDDRVLPGHSYKFAATLQAAQQGAAPILLSVSRRAGHGAGKPTSLRIAEAANRLAFLEMTIGTR